MEAAANNYCTGGRHTENRDAPPRTEATFTEIYELIYNSRSLVRSELDVLQKLIDRKINDKIREKPAIPRMIVSGRL